MGFTRADPAPPNDLDACRFDRRAAESGHNLTRDQGWKLGRPRDGVGVFEVPTDWIECLSELDDRAFVPCDLDDSRVDAQPTHRLSKAVVMGEDDDLVRTSDLIEHAGQPINT